MLAVLGVPIMHHRDYSSCISELQELQQLHDYVPLIHKTDQASEQMYHGHQKVLSSHNHSLPLLPPQKFEKLILFDSHGPSLLATHSPLELDNCYHQTEHESKGLLSCCQLSDDHHTLCKVEKKDKQKLVGCGSDLILIIIA